jgi:hypothetical protein
MLENQELIGRVGVALCWGCVLLIMVGIPALMFMGKFGTPKTHKIDESKWKRTKVSFSGKSGDFTVTYVGLEVYEDSTSHQRKGVISGFDDEFLEKVVSNEWYLVPKKSFHKEVCAQCGAPLQQNAHHNLQTQEFKLKGVTPFKVTIGGPFIECGSCGASHVAGEEDLVEALDDAIDNSGLILEK